MKAGRVVFIGAVLLLVASQSAGRVCVGAVAASQDFHLLSRPRPPILVDARGNGNEA